MYNRCAHVGLQPRFHQPAHVYRRTFAQILQSQRSTFPAHEIAQRAAQTLGFQVLDDGQWQTRVAGEHQVPCALIGQSNQATRESQGVDSARKGFVQNILQLQRTGQGLSQSVESGQFLVATLQVFLDSLAFGDFILKLFIDHCQLRSALGHALFQFCSVGPQLGAQFSLAKQHPAHLAAREPIKDHHDNQPQTQPDSIGNHSGLRCECAGQSTPHLSHAGDHVSDCAE